MSRVITINGAVRTKDIKLEGTNPESELTYAEDGMSFIVKSGIAPGYWQEIIVDDDTERIFGGLINSIRQVEIAPGIIWYYCRATDYAYQLDAKEVNESYGQFNLFTTALAQKFDIAWISGTLNGTYKVSVGGGTGSLILTGGAEGTVEVGGELVITVDSAAITFTPTDTPTDCVLMQFVRADEIILDIAGRYCSGFTTANVSGPAPLVEYIEFIAKRPSECFRTLCEYTGWDWFVDYTKDIWFFDPTELAIAAPITVDGGAEVQNLVHELEVENFRNRIKVIGANYLSDAQSFEFVCDGTATSWKFDEVPYDIHMTEDDDPVTVGVEGEDEETDFDFMVDPETAILRTASSHATPAAGVKLEGTYKYQVPVIALRDDKASQVAAAAIMGGDGIFEHTIIDESITTLDAAEALCLEQLAEFANPRVRGSFITHTAGWAAGQIVPINRPDRNIVGGYVVQKVNRSPVRTDLWETRIEYGGRLIGPADYLKALVSAQQQKVTTPTTISKFEYGEEEVGVRDELEAIYQPLPFVCGGRQPVFTRPSVANLSDGTLVATGLPRFEAGQHGRAVLVEEGTTNLLTANQASGGEDGTTTGFSARNSATVTRDTAEKYAGEASVKVETPGAVTREGVNIYKSVAGMTVGSMYTASVWLRGGGTVHLYLEETPGYQSTSIVVGLTEQWTRYSISHTITAEGRTGMTISIYTIATVQAVTFWADNLQLEAKDHVTSWHPGGSTRAKEMISIPSAGIVRPDKGTFEVWIKRSNLSTAEGQVIFLRNPDWGIRGGLLLRILNNTIKFITGDGSAFKELSSAVLSWTTADWYHIAVTWDVAAQYKKIYRNGVKVAEDLTWTEGYSLVNADYIYLGHDMGGGATYLNALFDDLRISSHPRTDAEIAAAYSSGAALAVDGATSYKLGFDGSLEDVVSTPVCGFVLCAAGDTVIFYDSGIGDGELQPPWTGWGNWIKTANGIQNIDTEEGWYSYGVDTGDVLDCEVSVKVKFNGECEPGLWLRGDLEYGYILMVGLIEYGDVAQVFIRTVTDWTPSSWLDSTEFAYSPGTEYELKAKLQGNSIKVYVDDWLAFEFTDPGTGIDNFYYGLFSIGGTLANEEIFRDFKITV